MRHRWTRTARLPIRHPFIEIAGDVYLMPDWFALEEGRLSRRRILLVRLTERELRIYDAHRSKAESVGDLLSLVRRRLGRYRREVRY